MSDEVLGRRNEASVLRKASMTSTREAKGDARARPRVAYRDDSDRIAWTSPHMLVGVVASLVLVYGWFEIDELDLTPADGLGYGLGFVGMGAMVLLLAYSVRKRVRALRHVGLLRNWFEAHLVLGLLAPVAILYHATFRVESTNAAVALTCMLVVAGSGIGGRFLYGRLHRGLAGELRSVGGMQRAARACLEPVRPVIDGRPEVLALIERFEAGSAGLTSGLIQALSAATLRLRARLARRRVARVLRSAGETAADVANADRAVAACLAELCRAGELRLFTQLFALWHAIHIPLTVILFLSAIVHIVAVHLY